MTVAAFLTIALIHLAAAISPGPSFVVSVRTAVSSGFATATALAFGFGLGALSWAFAAMAGLALVFELVPALFVTLKFVGAAFLIWIAYQMWRHAPEPIDMSGTEGKRMTTWQAIRYGFLTFASNPKPAVFFGAVFVGMVPVDTPLTWRIAILAAVFLNETLWYILVARLFSLTPARKVYLGLKTTIDRIFSGFLVLLGLKIAFD